MIGFVTQQIAAQAMQDEQERVERWQRAWALYCGEMRAPLRVKPGQPDDNVLVNFARQIVDTGVSFLFGREVHFDSDMLRESKADQWLAQCWQSNRKMTLLHKLATNGAIFGHVFIKIVPASPGTMGFPRLVVLDPATVNVRWKADDIDEVEWYHISYAALDAQSRPITVRQRIERHEDVWHIIDEHSRNGREWTTTSARVWGWSWPPIIDAQNLPVPNCYWGMGDLEPDVLRLNDAINATLSNIARILRFHAHPKTWGSGFNAERLNIAADETIVLPSPDAELHNLEMQSDLESSINFYTRLKEALYMVSRTPEVATGKLEQPGNLSGVALQLLYRPLLEKTETKRRTYGDLLTELNRRLLALGGFGEEQRTVVQWGDMLPHDALQQRQVLQIDRALGVVSQTTMAQRLGYDPATEQALQAQEEQRSNV